MLKKIISSIGLCSLLGCTNIDDKSDIDERQNESPKESSIKEEVKIGHTIKSVYNQAYQENYKKDNIKSIIENAQDSYILVDPFDDIEIEKYISKLKANHNLVAGYISVGTGEEFRNDYKALKPYLTKKSWPDWPDEYYISETKTGVLDIMKNRIDKMASWGIDWVEFDNMDWLTTETRKKFKLTSTVKESRDYVNALCDYTHSKGMKCMAKNTTEGFENFDGVTYESYHKEKNWWDTKGTKDFLNNNKLVIINHYKESNCKKVYEEYKEYYSNNKILFICEDSKVKKYKHYSIKK
jgi:hypothetical protein